MQRTTRSPYLTDSRVQTFYFLRKMGTTGEIFSLEDLSNVLNGYQLSSILRCLPRWKDLMLTLYRPEDGRTFFESRRPDRQFYTCRPLSLWDDWGPFMQSCFWDHRPILSPRPEALISLPDPISPPPPSLPRDFYLLAGVIFCILVLLFCGTILQDTRKQWTIVSWSNAVARMLLVGILS